MELSKRVHKKLYGKLKKICLAENIKISSVPTKTLLIANGGLANNVSHENIFELFSQFGEIESIVMVPKKSHSFISYISKDSAISAVNTVQAQTINGSKVVLYVGYITTIPEFDQPIFALPPGADIYLDFITESQETQILSSLDRDITKNDCQSTMKNRHVMHYGYRFVYGSNDIDRQGVSTVEPIPDLYSSLMDRAFLLGYIDHKPDQLTINHYHPGQGIPPHIDTHSACEESLASLSLAANVVMDFRNPDGKQLSFSLPRRSLLVLRGDARYLWTHGITPRRYDIIPVTAHSPDKASVPLTLVERQARTSLTFRKVRDTPCTCKFMNQCDSQRKKQIENSVLKITKEEASKLEKLHVHEVYEKIASHFSSTRHSPWPKISDFITHCAPGSTLADIGCGNGKYLHINDSLFKVGCDRSMNLSRICYGRGYPVFVCDALSVPLRSNTFDYVLSVAVIHHFSTLERRLRAVSEIVRIMVPGGLSLISVWALEQDLKTVDSRKISPQNQPALDQSVNKYISQSKSNAVKNVDTSSNCRVETSSFDSQDSLTTDSGGDNNPGKKLTVHVNRTPFKAQDMLVPWHLTDKQPDSDIDSANSSRVDKKDVGLEHRFYHLFRTGELESLCKQIPNVVVKESYYDKGNWCVIITKH